MTTGKTKINMAARAAVLYYNKSMSQNEIALMLGISRSYVSQLLALARETGIVKISVQSNGCEREIEFAARHGIGQAFIMLSQSKEVTDAEFGSFCAPHTARLLRGARNIGVNLGDTVRKVIYSLQAEDLRECRAQNVVQIMGGCVQSEANPNGVMPNELVFCLGNLLKCRCLYLNCPALLSNEAIRTLIRREESIRSICQAWEQLDVVLMGMGRADRCRLVAGDEALEREVRSSNAVADINFNFFDTQGGLVELFGANKLVLESASLAKIPCKVVYAYGYEKAQAILAGLRAKMIDVLFTDSITADAIDKLA